VYIYTKLYKKMEASRKPKTADTLKLPPKVAKAVEQKPQLLDMPLKDLPEDIRAEMIGHLIGPIEGATHTIESAPVGRLIAGLRHMDDRLKLMSHFEDAQPLKIKEARNVTSMVQQAPQDYLVDVEREMAKIIAGPPQHHAMKLELYQKLTDPRYIGQVVGKALAQMIAHGIITQPYEAGTIRYSRVTADIDNPTAADEGCVLTFHPPVEDGAIVHGVTRRNRIGMKRSAVSFFFNNRGELTSAVKQDTPEGKQKIEAPYNARIHIVPPSTGKEEYGYFYRRVQFAEDPRYADKTPASPEIRREAKRIESTGSLVGLIKAEQGGGDEYLVFEFQNGRGTPYRKAVRKSKGRLPQMVYDVKEEPCVQAKLGDVRFGIHVKSKDMGLPQSEAIGDMVNKICVEKCLWSGKSDGRSYAEKKQAVHKTIREIVDAVPGLKMEPAEEQMADTRRFISNNRMVIAHITGLRDEIETMRNENPDGFASLFSDKKSQQILGFNGAQFFQAASKMIATRDVLNVTYPLESLERFVEEWRNNMSTEERQEVMQHTSITTPILMRLDVMERTLRAEHSGLKQEVHDEGEKTRASVESAGKALITRIGRVGDEQVSMLADGIRDISEAIGSMGDENRELLKALGVEEEGMHSRLLKALEKPKDTKLIVETGVNLGVFAVKLQKTMPAKEAVMGVGEPYMIGAKMLFEDVKEKLASGFRKMGKAFGRIKDALLDSLSPEEERNLSQLTNLYSDMGDPGAYVQSTRSTMLF